MTIQTIFSDLGKVVLTEHMEQLGKSDFSMFAEEHRRMQKYDSEVCPARWQAAVQYVAKKGWDPIEVLARFGERKFYGSYWDKREELRYSQDDMEKMIAIYNYVEQERKKLQKPLSEWSVYAHLPLDKGQVCKDLEKILRSKKLKKRKDRHVVETWKDEHHNIHISEPGAHKRKDHSSFAFCFPLRDKIPGILTLFGCCEHEGYSSWDYDKYDNDAAIYGIPEKNPRVFFELGRLDISSLKPIVKRRFTYIFGTVPLNDEDIIEALVELNGFPPIDVVRYRLYEERLSELKPTKGISLMHKEALKARKKGLFTDIKVYKLVSEKRQRIRDPVIVGIDPFGQKYPIVYWAGDSKNSKKDK